MKASFLNIIFIITLATMLLHYHYSAAQNSVVLNGGFIMLNGGTSSTPIFVVVNQSNTTGISRISGHIISEGQYNYVRWTVGSSGNYVFPFGYSTTDYLPFSINKTSGASTAIDASTWGTGSANTPWAGVSDNGTVNAVSFMTGAGGATAANSVIDRWWDVYSPSLTANVTFSYRGVENTMTSPTSALSAQHWNGSTWESPLAASSSGVTTGVGSTSVNGISNKFSPWVLVKQSSPLPVTITTFNAVCLSKGIQLTWATASESNSDFFTVERSEDGEAFKMITTLPAAGTSKTLKNYVFTDYEPLAKVYYRLKETDLDGSYSYYKTIHADCEFMDEESAVLFPNPVADVLNYTIVVLQKGKVALEIFDQTGRVIMQSEFDAHPGINNYTTNVSPLTDGFYYVKINYGAKSSLIKFVKVK